jgi:hypothetical protein
MYHDTHNGSEHSEASDETTGSDTFDNEREGLVDAPGTGAIPPLDGAAQRLMDGLLRECLRGKSLAS